MSTAAQASAAWSSHASSGEPLPVRDGDDACPGALRLHTADDGALARVRVPGGLLTAAQASALADAAERLGDGELHLTSRGNVQLRGLPEECGPELAVLLADAGLLPSPRHERVRNVVASPLSGLDGRGYADVLPWAAELDRLLCGSPTAARLSGRFLFAFDDGRGDVAALGADVTVVADPRCAGPHGGDAGAGPPPWESAPAAPTRPIPGAEPRTPDAAAEVSGPPLTSGAGNQATEPGASASTRVGPITDTGSRSRAGTATVYVGGQAAVRVPGGEAAQTALLTAELFLDTVRKRGVRAWRVGELPNGAEPVARALARSLATDGARGSAPGSERDGDTSQASPAAPRAWAGHPGPTGWEEGAHPSSAGPEPGTVRGPDGHVTLSVTVSFGTLTASQWRLLAATAETDGIGELRLTPWRGVVLPGLRPDTAQAQLAELAAAGLVTTADSPWYGLGACAGRPGCAKALADVRADARDAVRHRNSTRDRDRDDLPVYWSGCARRCGRPKGAHVDVVATGDGRYDVSVHGSDVSVHGGEARHHHPTADTTELAAAISAAAARTTAAER